MQVEGANGGTPAAGTDPADRLHALFDRWWDQEMAESPESATSIGWPGHDDRWSEQSPHAVARRRRAVEDALEAAAGIDRDALDDHDRLHLDLFVRELRGRRELAAFPQDLLAVTKMSGPHETIPRTLSLAPRDTMENLLDAVARLRGVPGVVEETVAALGDGLAGGVTATRVAIEDVPDQLEALAASPAPLVAPFERRPATVRALEFEQVRDDAMEAVAAEVAPALRRLAEFLRTTYLPRCRTSVGWSDLPDGRDWYRRLVAWHTTTDLAPEEIHRVGLEEVERIRGDMDDVIASTGHDGSFASFCELLRTDDRFFHRDPQALLAAYRDIAKRIDPELPRLFGSLPSLPYGVREVPAHQAPSTTTAYYERGSPPAGRPGWFYANTYDLRSRPTWEMEALTLHEAVPGHHLQLALAAELEGLPHFRALSLGPTAFVEGWGLYAESLGDELGLYRDPYSRFGKLTYEMWRAVRLVVDTGMHVLGWTREQAIGFFRDHSSKPLHDITVEVDRYISWPGQALAYKIGELTFTRLRRRAASRLGDRFDVRAFHDAALGAGALPLDVLEARIEAWIEHRSSQP